MLQNTSVICLMVISNEREDQQFETPLLLRLGHGFVI